jgi:hypothetical protein
MKCWWNLVVHVGGFGLTLTMCSGPKRQARGLRFISWIVGISPSINLSTTLLFFAGRAELR